LLRELLNGKHKNERGLDKRRSWVYIPARKLSLQAKVKANLKVSPKVEVKGVFFYKLTKKLTKNRIKEASPTNFLKNRAATNKQQSKVKLRSNFRF